MGADSVFGDLRKLADWFATLPQRASAAPPLHVERLVVRLGTSCVPLLGRELCTRDGRRREAARGALAQLATDLTTRTRVIAELRRIAASDAGDDGKVCALGLLAELGERGEACFTDPPAIQRRSALALAAQLTTQGDVAAAADMMIRQLAEDDVLQLLSVMADAAPPAAHRLGSELCVRLDVDAALREQIARVALADEPGEPVHGSRSPRPTRVDVLVDAAARLVVVASRKIAGARRWRRWAVLIDARGAIDDCIHEDQADGDNAVLIASLVADGYRVASDDYEHARAIVAAAARHSAETTDRLGSAYYLGRDLLDLGEAHLGGRTHAHPISTTLGRAVELLADGEPARARALLARCDRDDPRRAADVAATAAACLLAQNQPGDAIAHLLRAIDHEPDWPLHHWNLAAACHVLGDTRGCYHALRRFLTTSTQPTGLYADPDQPGRVALAHRLIGELERSARLAGTPLVRPPRRRRRTTRAPQRQKN
ncbi:MAG: tetratricopeptide repeat protein [Acidobacteriota bacterium]